MCVRINTTPWVFWSGNFYDQVVWAGHPEAISLKASSSLDKSSEPLTSKISLCFLQMTLVPVLCPASTRLFFWSLVLFSCAAFFTLRFALPPLDPPQAAHPHVHCECTSSSSGTRPGVLCYQFCPLSQFCITPSNPLRSRRNFMGCWFYVGL